MDTPESTAGDGAEGSGTAVDVPRRRPAPWILLRGPLRDRRHWGSLPGRLARLAPGQVVEAVDLDGNGSRYRETSASSVADMVEQVREGVRRRGITAPVRVLAMSLGAMVAVEWARRYPAEVDHLVLVNAALAPHAPWWQRLNPSLWWPLLRLLSLPATAEHWELALLRHASQRYRREESPARTTLLGRWVAWREAQPVRRGNLLRQLWAAACYRAPTPPAVPGLLLVSARDRIADPQCSFRLAEAWGWPVLAHPKAGHDVALDDPRWLLRQLHRRFAALPGEWLAPDPQDDDLPFEVEEVDDPRPQRRRGRPAAPQDVIDLDPAPPAGAVPAETLALVDAPATDWGPSLHAYDWGLSDWDATTRGRHATDAAIAAAIAAVGASLHAGAAASALATPPAAVEVPGDAVGEVASRA